MSGLGRLKKDDPAPRDCKWLRFGLEEFATQATDLVEWRAIGEPKVDPGRQLDGFERGPEG